MAHKKRIEDIENSIKNGNIANIPKTLPCPFCGKNEIYTGPASAMSYHARCLNCGSQTKEFYLPDESEESLNVLEKTLIHESIIAWNQRI